MNHTNLTSRRRKFSVASPFLGFNIPDSHDGFGLAMRKDGPVDKEGCQPYLHQGKAHILTIGSTGSGKTNLLIANLLLYNGSMIVVDIRGDAVLATERFRRVELGQATYVVDPFGVTRRPTARLDPVDIHRLAGVEPESESQTLAASLLADHHFARDPFWHASAETLIASNLAYLMAHPDESKHSMNALLDALYCDDVTYSQAVLLDTVIPKHTFAYTGIASFLQLPDGNNSGTRSSVLGTAHTALSLFRSSSVRATLGPGNINLNDLLEGKPMTIYLVMPIHRVVSHGILLRLWLDVLLQVLMRRTRMPELPTIVAIDEAAQIGPSAALKTVTTFMRAAGVRLWTMWQDLSQIKSLYPTDWSTFLNNASALTFMPGNDLASRELAAVAGLPLGLVAELAEDQQLVRETGIAHRKVRLAQYWRDPLFEGRYDPLPRYEPSHPPLNRK